MTCFIRGSNDMDEVRSKKFWVIQPRAGPGNAGALGEISYTQTQIPSFTPEVTFIHE